MNIDLSGAIVCYSRCLQCGAISADEFCSDRCRYAYPEIRWACSCGRFIAEADVCSIDRYAPLTTYYGVETETHYHCSRCGFRQGEPHLIATRTIWPTEAQLAEIRGAS